MSVARQAVQISGFDVELETGSSSGKFTPPPTVVDACVFSYATEHGIEEDDRWSEVAEPRDRN